MYQFAVFSVSIMLDLMYAVWFNLPDSYVPWSYTTAWIDRTGRGRVAIIIIMWVSAINEQVADFITKPAGKKSNGGPFFIVFLSQFQTIISTYPPFPSLFFRAARARAACHCRRWLLSSCRLLLSLAQSRLVPPFGIDNFDNFRVAQCVVTTTSWTITMPDFLR